MSDQHVILPSDSPALGKRDSFGNITKWPETDIDGKPYIQGGWTIRYLGDGSQFVVYHPMREIGIVTIAGAASSNPGNPDQSGAVG